MWSRLAKYSSPISRPSLSAKSSVKILPGKVEENWIKSLCNQAVCCLTHSTLFFYVCLPPHRHRCRQTSPSPHRPDSGCPSLCSGSWRAEDAPAGRAERAGWCTSENNICIAYCTRRSWGRRRDNGLWDKITEKNELLHSKVIILLWFMRSESQSDCIASGKRFGLCSV